MASDLRITDLVAGAMLNNMFGAANVDADAGLINIYADAGTPDIPTGQPSVGASHGTLLAQLTMNADSFANATADGAYMKIVANAITSDSSANASGDAKYFVLYNDDSPDVALMQGTVDIAGNSPDMVIDAVAIAAGATVSCSSFVIKMPKGWTT